MKIFTYKGYEITNEVKILVVEGDECLISWHWLDTVCLCKKRDKNTENYYEVEDTGAPGHYNIDKILKISRMLNKISDKDRRIRSHISALYGSY